MPKGHSEARGVGFVNKGQKSIHCPVCPDAEILHRLYVYVECCVLRVHISCVCVGYSIYVHVLCCVCVFVCVCNLPLLSLPTMNPFRQTIAIIVLWNRLYRLNRLSCSFSLIISQNCKNFNFSTNYTLRGEIKIYMLNHTRLSLNNNQKKCYFSEYFHMLDTVPGGALQTFSHLIIRTVIRGWHYYYHPHFTDKEVEA